MCKHARQLLLVIVFATASSCGPNRVEREEPPEEVDLEALPDAEFYDAVMLRLEFHAMRVVTKMAEDAQRSVREMQGELAHLDRHNTNEVNKLLRHRAASYEAFLRFGKGVTKEFAMASADLERLREMALGRAEQTVKKADREIPEINALRSRLAKASADDSDRPAIEAILQAKEAALKASRAQGLIFMNLTSHIHKLIEALKEVEASINKLAFVMSEQAKALDNTASVIHLTWQERLAVLAAQNSPEPLTRPISEGIQRIFDLLNKLKAKDFPKEIPDSLLK